MLFCGPDHNQQLNTSTNRYYSMESTSEPTTPPPPSAFSGSCACGKDVYHSSTPPLSITFCHCIECRKASGAPFLAFGLFHNTALQWVSSSADRKPPIRITPSPDSKWGPSMAVRGACGECGSPLFMKYHCRPDGTGMVMGIVDNSGINGPIPPPKKHILLSDQASCWNLPQGDGLARHYEFNEPFQARLRAWCTAGCPERTDVVASTNADVLSCKMRQFSNGGV